MANAPTVTVEQAKILAKLRQRSQGSYDRIKQTEAKAGGKSLPGGLQNAVGQLDRVKLDLSTGEKKAGEPYIYLYARCVEPIEHNGTPCGLIFGLWDDEYNSYNDNFEAMINAFKLLGPTGSPVPYQDWIESTDEAGFFDSVFPSIMADIEQRKPFFLFNTSRRARKDGDFNLFIQGIPAVGYQAPVTEKPNEHAGVGYVSVTTPASNKPAGPPIPVAAVAPKPTPAKGPAKPMPARKPPGATPPPPQKPQCPVSLQQEAMTTGNVYGNGVTYYGIIDSINEDQQTVNLNIDGSLYDVKWVNIAASDGNAPQAAPVIEVGLKVNVIGNYFADGAAWSGVVKSMNATDAEVEFPGYQPIPIPLANLEVA